MQLQYAVVLDGASVQDTTSKHALQSVGEPEGRDRRGGGNQLTLPTLHKGCEQSSHLDKALELSSSLVHKVLPSVHGAATQRLAEVRRDHCVNEALNSSNC